MTERKMLYEKHWKNRNYIFRMDNKPTTFMYGLFRNGNLPINPEHYLDRIYNRICLQDEGKSYGTYKINKK